MINNLAIEKALQHKKIENNEPHDDIIMKPMLYQQKQAIKCIRNNKK